MQKIQLTQGKIAIVDDQDFEWLSRWKWCYCKGYAVRKAPKGSPRVILHMHRVIAETPMGMFTDHINGNGLDNRRSNLRNATYRQSAANVRKQKDRSSKYKGVTWYAPLSKWKSHIRTQGTEIHLGYFDDEKEAGYIYDQVAISFHGEFARCNFLTENIFAGD